MFINGVYSIRYIKSVFAVYPQNPKSSTIYIPVDALISKQPGTTNIAFRAFSTHAKTMFEIEAHPYFQNQCRKEPYVVQFSSREDGGWTDEPTHLKSNFVQLDFPR